MSAAGGLPLPGAPAIVAAASATRTRTDRRHPIHAERNTILLVDDDASARRLVARLLAEEGYEVLDAVGPVHALDVASSHAQRIGLLLTDIRMPVMSGLDLAARFGRLVPAAGVLLMSGYHDHGDVGHPLLEKPFTPGELATAVRQALGDPVASS